MSERVHSAITVGEYEQLCEVIVMLTSHRGNLNWTVGHTGEYLNPSKDHLDLVNAIDTLRTLICSLQTREQKRGEE